MAPLRQPGCERARDNAEHGRDDGDSVERRVDRQRSMVNRSERIERNGHQVMVGERETQQDE